MFTKGNRRYFCLNNLEILSKETPCNTKYLLFFQVQPVQHVYPPQVQYVEGGDAVYTNGSLYVVSSPSPERGLAGNQL